VRPEVDGQRVVEYPKGRCVFGRKASVCPSQGCPTTKPRRETAPVAASSARMLIERSSGQVT
jgi:hypothetical protein